jgi:hypothetical protein
MLSTPAALLVENEAVRAVPLTVAPAMLVLQDLATSSPRARIDVRYVPPVPPPETGAYVLANV